MNYYETLNSIIDEIEKNLTKKIEYKNLAKIAGTSSYTLQRIFAFLTNITLTDYIRKRRLSNAAEELLTTDIKIIDLALKYQYDSPVSFSNAFKKHHGISPQNMRKEQPIIKSFPKIEFKPTIEVIDELECRIVQMDQLTLYGITTGFIYDTDNKAVRDLFDKARKEKILDFIIENSDGKELYYGVSAEISYNEIPNRFKYYILGKTPRKGFSKLEIPKATWACFKLDNKKQVDILKLYNTIYTRWLPSSKYTDILNYPELEIYYKDSCEICIAVQ